MPTSLSPGRRRGGEPLRLSAEMCCTLTVGGQSIAVTETVTSVGGSNVNFDVEVDEL